MVRDTMLPKDTIRRVPWVGVVLLLFSPLAAWSETFIYSESVWSLNVTEIKKNGAYVSTINSSDLGNLGGLKVTRGFSIDENGNKVVGTGSAFTQLLNENPPNGSINEANQLTAQTLSMTLISQAETHVV